MSLTGGLPEMLVEIPVEDVLLFVKFRFADAVVH